MLNQELKQKLKELIYQCRLCENLTDPNDFVPFRCLITLYKNLCNELHTQLELDTLNYQRIIYFKLCMIDISFKAWVPCLTELILENCLEICERHQNE